MIMIILDIEHGDIDFMNIKRLFCEHKRKKMTAWKFIKKTREQCGQYVLGLPVYANYNYYLIDRVCLDCGKEFLGQTHKEWVEPEASSVLY